MSLSSPLAQTTQQKQRKHPERALLLLCEFALEVAFNVRVT